MTGSHPNALYWDSTYAIVQCLMESHPDLDLDTVGIEQLYAWVINLPNFADDPSLANEAILNEILREWYEEGNVT
jgi:FeS assembly protein IscX